MFASVRDRVDDRRRHRIGAGLIAQLPQVAGQLLHWVCARGQRPIGRGMGIAPSPVTHALHDHCETPVRGSGQKIVTILTRSERSRSLDRTVCLEADVTQHPVDGPVSSLGSVLGAYLEWNRHDQRRGDIHLTLPGRRGVVVRDTPDLAPPDPPTPNATEIADLVDVVGFTTTGTDGRAVVHVRDYLWGGDIKLGRQDEVWVTATARSSEFVAVTHDVRAARFGPGSDPDDPFTFDLQIHLFTWARGGQAKTNVPVTWRAVLHA